MTPMQLGTGMELEILRLAMTVGVFMGAIYTLFSVVRRILRAAVAVFICDFVYALMFGTVFFVFSLAQTDYIRGFIFIAMAIGAVLWQLSLGRIVTAFFYKFADAADKFIIYPAISVIAKISRMIGRIFVKSDTISEK